jgi:uncharacterized damage-inducible protein DinB
MQEPAPSVDAQPALDNYRFLARYNRWFNQRLYAACAQVPDARRRQECGAFFGSIHGTLNHLLWADRLWLKRFAAQGEVFPMLTAELLALPDGARHATVLHEDWEELGIARDRLDEAIEQWAAAFTPRYITMTMRYTNMAGQAREHALWKALTHFFNHQAHHRGQLTTLLSQAGVDVGLTDLIALA